MILVVGSAASGKTEYVKSLGWGEEQISDAMIDERPVVDSLHLIVEKDPSSVDDLYELLKGKQVVICNEVGSGIIPATQDKREAREQTGRLCNKLAQNATEVVRMVAGIPIVIKGEQVGL